MDKETEQMLAKGRLPYIHPRQCKLNFPDVVRKVLAIQEPDVTLIHDISTGYYQIKCNSASTFWRTDFIFQLIIGADIAAGIR